MRRHIIADLFAYPKPNSASRRRLALLAKTLEQRTPGRHQFQHLAILPSGTDPVSLFVELDSLACVAGLIESM